MEIANLKNKKTLLIIGAFDFKTMDSGGQLVKTRELYYLFKEKTFFQRIRFVDTSRWKKFLFFKIFELFFKIIVSNYVIMLPAYNGLSVFSKILPIFRRKKKIYYDVIGGWLPRCIKEDHKLKKRLSCFNGIFVETTSMKESLSNYGLINVYVVPNFKKIIHPSKENRERLVSLPLKICTFSRVVKEKGIGEAIEAVTRVNSFYKQRIYELDIYGPVDDSFKEEFDRLLNEHSDCARYLGVIDTKCSYEVLTKYFALVFPTRFYTEGIPGTFIDAYNAGLPVITSLWMNYSDIFDDGIHGYGYKFDELDGLYNCLCKAYRNRYVFSKMSDNCARKSRLFGEEHAYQLMIKIFEGAAK